MKFRLTEPWPLGNLTAPADTVLDFGKPEAGDELRQICNQIHVDLVWVRADLRFCFRMPHLIMPTVAL